MNATESRRLFLENCGFEDDLVISDASFAPNTPGDFQVAEIPWASQTLAVGEVLELMVDLVPDPARVPGTALNGRILFTTNISDRQTNADLRAGIGQPDRCNLVPVPTEVDFGWVATDEAGPVAHVHHHRFRRLTAGSDSHAFNQLRLRTSEIFHVPM